jgi:hypothetical protein
MFLDIPNYFQIIVPHVERFIIKKMLGNGNSFYDE